MINLCNFQSAQKTRQTSKNVPPSCPSSFLMCFPSYATDGSPSINLSLLGGGVVVDSSDTY